MLLEEVSGYGDLGPQRDKRDDQRNQWCCLSKLDHFGSHSVFHGVFVSFNFSNHFINVISEVWFAPSKFETFTTEFGKIPCITAMDTLNALRQYGESMGLKDSALVEFVKEQQAIQRDERNAERELEKERIKLQEEKEKINLDFEKEKLRIEIELLKVEKESQRIDASMREENSQTHQCSGSGQVRPRVPKLPVFDDSRDEIDSYLLRFERYAESQNWDRADWAVNLSALLKGKALDVYALMPSVDAFDYDILKRALLRRFELTEDGFKKKFRACRPEPSETFSQFAVRLSSYFDRWIEMAKAQRTFVSLYDLMLRDQFYHVCGNELKLFLKERIPESFIKMAELADQFKDARNTSALQVVNKGKSFDKKPDQTKKPERTENKERYDKKEKFVSNRERKCFRCHKLGHIAAECKSKQAMNRVSQVLKDDGSKDESEPKVSFVVTLPTNSVVDSQVSQSPTTLSTACQRKSNFNMPISAGYINGYPVTVLRDTGCNGIVARKSKVHQENFVTGKQQTCTLADGSKVTVPVALVAIDTPYLQGNYEVWCMENPVYDLIVGNVPEARPADQPNPEWQIHAVETRQQKRSKDKPYPALKVPEVIKDEIDPEVMKAAQEEDQTLAKHREYASQNITHTKRNGKVRWYKKKGLLFREFVMKEGENDKVFVQLVVPQKFRGIIMKLAHESLFAGHLGTQRTVTRVTAEFYWPGIQSDVRRFCQSCDICQRTLQKGKTSKVPLERMPLIDEPFQRVAVDLVGPLSPVTEKGNRYILTLVDYATRYPEAIALPGIETERVAEALMEIFSRIGVPREMLTDMGAQFTSSLMSEVSRLISLKQWTTTPYHPSCNGLVERFNGTLKQILKRLCAEKPKDWDKYLSAVLFAYREVPQESLGFSPFELVYGRTVRGPITILKELWTKEIEDPDVKTTYQYVLDLKERLESMSQLAKENLQKSSIRYKKIYDRKTRKRYLKVGDKVLVLLPTDHNKLLLQWKGPYKVTKKVNRVDYQLDMLGKSKTFHINLLKKYMERSTADAVQFVTDDSVFGLVSATVVDCESDEIQEGKLHDYPVLAEIPKFEMDINQSLKQDEIRQLMTLFRRYEDVLQDQPGLTNVLEHEIRMVSERPIHVKNRPVPYTMEETVNREVSDMLSMNIIEPSDSPFCSPVVIVPKKDGSNRFCIDFRMLNSQTIFDSEPMPDPDEMFSKLAGHKYFSKIDLSKGYWQVKLSDESKPKTAFRTSKGLFQFRVMPFGLVTAPATFSRLMRKVLYGMEKVDNFIDDILLYSSTFDAHVDALEELFERLRDAELTAKPSKCSFAYPSLMCLGHIVGDEQLKPCSDKVMAIRDAPRPETKKQLRSFLGLCGFYRKFVPNFSQVALPLSDLTRKGCPTKLVWEQSHELAFQSLKAALTNYPILKLPNLSEPFVLQTDASDRGLGAVLLQYVHDQKLPVGYASRKLKESESSYATVEKECLAIVWAIQKFQKYLYGREFILETDHSPLVYLNRSKVTNPRLMRWALSLQPYRFKISAIRGKENVGVATVLLLCGGAAAFCVTTEVSNICGTTGSMYNCRNSHLKSIPRNIPSNSIAIDVSENNITTLYNNSFPGLDNLKAIYLQRNKINHIQKNAFHNLQHLCVLDLSQNQLTRESLDEGIFRNVHSLLDLQLADNFLTGGFPYDEIGKFKLLQNLSLSAYGLSRHFPLSFRNLKELKNLEIIDIDVSLLSNNSFENLAELAIKHLLLVFLNNGACANIDEDLLWPFSSIKGLRFQTFCGLRYAMRSLKLLQFRKMDYLDFSRTFPTNNDVQILKEEDLRYLRNICTKTFILRDAAIVRIATMGSAIFMKCLERIDLSQNMLRSSPFLFALMEATHVKAIDVSYQSYCGPFDHNRLNSNQMLQNRCFNFTVSPSIVELNFSYSFLEPSALPTTIIGNNVQRIDISYTGIEICSQTYAQIHLIVPCLSRVDLSGTLCEDLNVFFLKDLRSLSELYIRNANLNIGLEKDKKADLLRGLTNLTVIDLSENNLHRLHPNLFQSQTSSLEKLILNNNLLTAIPDALNAAASLRHLGLRSNKIASFSEEDTSILNHLLDVQLDVTGNPIDCSCDAIESLKWMHNHQEKFLNLNVTYCIEESDKSVFDVISNIRSLELRCVSRLWMQISVSVLSFTFLFLVTCSISYRYRMIVRYGLLRIRLFWKQGFSRITASNETTIDAYISYSPSDYLWVSSHLFNALNDANLKVALQDRDFLPGNPFTEEVVTHINKSRYVIFVITETFIQSDWGSYEIQVAKIHAIHTKAKLILIIKDNIQTEDLPRDLLYIWWKIKSFTYNENDTEIKRAKFWKRIISTIKE